MRNKDERASTCKHFLYLADYKGIWLTSETSKESSAEADELPPAPKLHEFTEEELHSLDDASLEVVEDWWDEMRTWRKI